MIKKMKQTEISIIKYFSLLDISYNHHIALCKQIQMTKW